MEYKIWTVEASTCSSDYTNLAFAKKDGPILLVGSIHVILSVAYYMLELKGMITEDVFLAAHSSLFGVFLIWGTVFGLFFVPCAYPLEVPSILEDSLECWNLLNSPRKKVLWYCEFFSVLCDRINGEFVVAVEKICSLIPRCWRKKLMVTAFHCSCGKTFLCYITHIWTVVNWNIKKYIKSTFKMEILLEEAHFESPLQSRINTGGGVVEVRFIKPHWNDSQRQLSKGTVLKSGSSVMIALLKSLKSKSLIVWEHLYVPQVRHSWKLWQPKQMDSCIGGNGMLKQFVQRYTNHI